MRRRHLRLRHHRESLHRRCRQLRLRLARGVAVRRRLRPAVGRHFCPRRRAGGAPPHAADERPNAGGELGVSGHTRARRGAGDDDAARESRIPRAGGGPAAHGGGDRSGRVSGGDAARPLRWQHPGSTRGAGDPLSGGAVPDRAGVSGVLGRFPGPRRGVRPVSGRTCRRDALSAVDEFRGRRGGDSGQCRGRPQCTRRRHGGADGADCARGHGRSRRAVARIPDGADTRRRHSALLRHRARDATARRLRHWPVAAIAIKLRAQRSRGCRSTDDSARRAPSATGPGRSVLRGRRAPLRSGWDRW
jgi:hypothetical protein